MSLDRYRSLALLARRLLIGSEDLGADRQEDLNLWLRASLRFAVAWWLFMAEDLRQRVPTNVVVLERLSLAQALNKYPTANFSPKLYIYVQSGTSDDFKSKKLSI